MSEFWGKFRGVVTDNDDPLLIGRVRARVPDVLGGDESGWALPNAPVAGGGPVVFAIPDVGTGIWIEFERGDPGHPIWTGAWWASAADVPPDVLTPPPPAGTVVITSAGGHSILIDDTPGTGGITLATTEGQKIVLNSLGIEIDNGRGARITLQGPQTSINDGGLDVV